MFASRPWVGDEQLPPPTRTEVRIYRFASLDRAGQALADFLAAPHWTEYTDPLIPTDGLTVVGSFTARLEPLRDDALLLPMPVALDEGWYVVEIPGDRPAQAFLQVTPVSAWVSVMGDRTVTWVNDVVTHGAIEGASVAVGGAGAFATSDADGLAIGDTPRALVPEAAGGEAGAVPPILRVTSPDGHVVLVPFDVGDDGPGYRGEWWETTGSADETYWSLLYTDRALYRRTDRIDVWGYLRGRDDGVAPSTVRVRLVGNLDNAREGDPDRNTIDSIDARPGPDGVFTASFPITKLPFGGYSVQAVVGGRIVASHWLEVSVVRKPAYQLRMTPDHTAVVDRDARHVHDDRHLLRRNAGRRPARDPDRERPGSHPPGDDRCRRVGVGRPGPDRAQRVSQLPIHHGATGRARGRRHLGVGLDGRVPVDVRPPGGSGPGR